MAAGNSHIVPNPHDAEEQMRPYLGRILDAEEATNAAGPVRLAGAALILTRRTAAEIGALNAALAKALELLGVQR